MSDRTPDETVCPLCGVGCRLKPTADESRAQGVAGPANPDGRLCRNGVTAFDTPDDRLTTPLVRRGGELRPASWETAYERVEASFGSILRADGPDALAFLGAPHCTNEENYLLQKLARMLGTNNVDNRSRLCHASTARILEDRVGWPATTNSLAGLREADVILVAGANPAERQPVAFNSFVRPAVNDGATLVHIEPAGNRTTRLADIHVTPRPGTDALVFDCLSRRLLAAETGVDRSFVDARTRGFERFAASMADAEPAAALTAAGVTGETIEAVASRLADADRIAGLVGTGIEGGTGALNAPEALLNMLLLTGNVGRRGSGLYVLRGLANEQGAADAGCVPDRLPGHQPVTAATARERVESEWGVAPPPTPGKTATALLESFGGEIRGALVVGENPAISKRDREWVQRRLDAIDSLVAVDLVANETTRHADVVLPAAAGTEKAGTFTNLERRIQRSRPVQTPPGEARPDRDILADLGTRLTDRPSAFEYADAGAVFDELCRVAPTHAGISDAAVGEGGRQWPAGEGGEDADPLYRERFETPDGYARFGTAQPFVEPDATDELRLVTGGRTTDRSAQGPAAPVLRINPSDAEERGLDDDVDEAAEALVVVSSGDVSVRATPEFDPGVRRGTAYLSADAADPLLRRGIEVVSVRSADAER
ncbi:molybdopterin oxidoreductase family protein [Halorubrum sp. FL23]|uniref:molybdopterin oxidoreductase family protein n=1 Tax=Halorubrum sp. FL23 TaxID=3458704 RepID=UPI004033CC77